jgi:hypothetical protein
LHPRDHCWLKLEFAERELDAFEADISRSLKEGPNGVEASVEKNGYFGDIRWVANLPAPPPIEWQVTSGRVCRELHSALDNLVCDLHRAAGGDCEHTAFPIFSSVEAYNHPRTGFVAKIRGIDPEAVAILRYFQPCQSGHPATDPLWMLARLANADKHRIGYGVQQIGASLPIEVIAIKGRFQIVRSTFMPSDALKHGDVIATARIVIEKDAKFKIKAGVRLKVVFEGGPCFDRFL